MIRPRRAIEAMQAYHAPREGRRGAVRLDFNEHTAGFPEAGPEGMPVDWVSAYPEYEAFTAQLAALWGVAPEQILLTNGSDEGLWIIPLTFIEPNVDAALIPRPTFALIPQYLQVAQARIVEVPVRADLSYDLPAIDEALARGIKLAIIPSPDNPTGAMVSPPVVRDWCTRYPETLFTLDEAYTEYAPSTVMPLIGELENLLVTRTFSKAWGLAGLRLGAVVGPARLIEYLRRVRPPYSVNSAAVWAATRLIDQVDRVRSEAQAAMTRKDALVQAIRQRGYEVLTGGGNFFLMSAGIEAPQLCGFCLERGVLIRNRSSGRGPQDGVLWGRIRVSTGTAAENERLLAALDAWRETHALIFDLDDTLVSTTRSFDAVDSVLVARYSGRELERSELLELRAEGGYNDDWDAVCELLRRRGIVVPRTRIAEEGTALYLSIARENETLMMDLEVLARLARRYRLFVATGRMRHEYAPIWGEELDPWFEQVYCRGDVLGCRPKPAPDSLTAILERHGLSHGIYVGNAVDDMMAARAAGLLAIGVTSTMKAEQLRQAGAQWVVGKTEEVGGVV